MLDFTNTTSTVIYRGSDGCDTHAQDANNILITECNVDNSSVAKNTHKMIHSRIKWLRKLIDVRRVRNGKEESVDDKRICKKVLYTICGCGKGVSFTSDLLTAKHYGAEHGKLWRLPRNKFSLQQHKKYKRTNSYVSTCYMQDDVDMYYIRARNISTSRLKKYAIKYKEWMLKHGKESKLNLQSSCSLFNRFLRSVAYGNSHKIYRSFLDKEYICFANSDKICIPKYEECDVYYKH